MHQAILDIPKRGRGRPKKEVTKDAGLMVKLTHTEHYILKQQAKAAGKTMSDFIRGAIGI